MIDEHRVDECPFDNPRFSIDINEPCPVCGDLATGYGADGISRCPYGFIEKENE